VTRTTTTTIINTEKPFFQEVVDLWFKKNEARNIRFISFDIYAYMDGWMDEWMDIYIYYDMIGIYINYSSAVLNK